MNAGLVGNVTFDASFMVAYSTKEPGRVDRARDLVRIYIANRANLYSPGVVAAESVEAICRKVREAKLTAEECQHATDFLAVFLKQVKPPPHGDYSLIRRAMEIRGTLGTGRVFDSFYIALAQQLTRRELPDGIIMRVDSELVTCDERMETLTHQHAPEVRVIRIP